MSQIIAGMYEIQEQIGAGGGGIVYLGRHLRLQKQVVLKADKRTLNTNAEILRREVDMLKGLSHSYIPQVYDFVQENGVVYTIMEFIEGESLDKLLKSGHKAAQPQVIRWACQLLEALVYLHSRPPHGVLHGDIKPANIMLRPGGDICLIDYNIALALGENGAVKAGFSRGYASPEHYGIDYVEGHSAAKQNSAIYLSDQTVEMTVTTTETMEKAVNVGATETIKQKLSPEVAYNQLPLSHGSSTLRHPSVMLDVRSDIYSLGATLYHLLSNQRPSQEAFGAEVLGADICSPAVAGIIRKAMEPDPKQRYQTAEEMLIAFHQLHKRDRRVMKHKRRAIVSAVVLSVAFLTGGACTFTGLKQLEQRQNALALAEYSANELMKGNVSGAVELALQTIPDGTSIFDAPATAQGQKALTDALGVYDLSEGFKTLDTVKLPSAPFKVEISPDGARFAVLYQAEVSVFNTEDGSKLVTLHAQNSALSDVIFVDNKRIIYAGAQGVTAYALDTEEILWTGDEATTLTISEDQTMVAAVNRDEEYAVIYSISDGVERKKCTFDGRHMPVAANDIFADPNNSIFALNSDGSMLAVSFSDGGLQIFDLTHPDGDLILYEQSEYIKFDGSFCGKYFALVADKSGESLFGLIDTEEAIYLGGAESQTPFLLQANAKGIYLAKGNLLVEFDSDTLEERELAFTDQVNITSFSIGEEYVLIATEDHGFSFYDSGANRMSSESSKENCDFLTLAGGYAVIGNRNEPSVRLMKLENHEESQLLAYDARYAHDEARISQDGRTAMLFDFQGFRIYDMNGQILNQVMLPDPDHIYDQQFVKRVEGSWLEVIWYDGSVRNYSAADGSVMAERKEEPPSPDLYEEFYTEDYRFTSPLHGTPEVYHMKSNKLVAVLEKDSYLTYVTEVGDYIITEYVSAAGERYGLLLDDKLQILAYLPRLCDISNGMLVFDYESGNLRQCRLYSLQELKNLGENDRK